MTSATILFASILSLTIFIVLSLFVLAHFSNGKVDRSRWKSKVDEDPFRENESGFALGSNDFPLDETTRRKTMTLFGRANDKHQSDFRGENSIPKTNFDALTEKQSFEF